jgi:hypothetical protein
MNIAGQLPAFRILVTGSVTCNNDIPGMSNCLPEKAPFLNTLSRTVWIFERQILQ